MRSWPHCAKPMTRTAITPPATTTPLSKRNLAPVLATTTATALMTPVLRRLPRRLLTSVPHLTIPSPSTAAANPIHLIRCQMAVRRTRARICFQTIQKMRKRFGSQREKLSPGPPHWPHPPPRLVYPVELQFGAQGDLGIIALLTNSNYIAFGGYASGGDGLPSLASSSPPFKAPGDRIVSVDGVPVLGKPFEEVVRLIKHRNEGQHCKRLIMMHTFQSISTEASADSTAIEISKDKSKSHSHTRSVTDLNASTTVAGRHQTVPKASFRTPAMASTTKESSHNEFLAEATAPGLNRALSHGVTGVSAPTPAARLSTNGHRAVPPPWVPSRQGTSTVSTALLRERLPSAPSLSNASRHPTSNALVAQREVAPQEPSAHASTKAQSDHGTLQHRQPVPSRTPAPVRAPGNPTSNFCELEPSLFKALGPNPVFQIFLRDLGITTVQSFLGSDSERVAEAWSSRCGASRAACRDFIGFDVPILHGSLRTHHTL